MKKLRKVCALSLCAALLLSSGCGKGNKPADNSKPQTEEKTVKEFTSFFAISDEKMKEPNTIQDLIAEKTGAKCHETWLEEGQDAKTILGDMITKEEYPDFIHAGAEHQQMLLDAQALAPIDIYWDDCENLKAFYSEDEWNRLRQRDGHIYYIPQFGNVNMYSTENYYEYQAFWIQVRVLKWAGYPKIETLDEYFKLIDDYLEAHPDEDLIGYNILTEDSLFMTLENVPEYLAGYPNDGCCIVNTDNKVPKAEDYNLTDTAYQWFKKLNEEYKKGTVDQSFSIQTKEEYMSKMGSGKVLGMVDLYWNFKSVDTTLPDDQRYVPLGIVAEEGIEEHYNSSEYLDVSQGLGISVDCDDIEGAVKFIDDLLDPEILRLRFWGIEGVDYSVDEDGIFYLSDEQRAKKSDKENYAKERCDYNYFPFYYGMSFDGKNSYKPSCQPNYLESSLSDIMKECFESYGVKTYTQLLNKSEQPNAWYPLWTYTNTLTDSSDAGKVMKSIDKVKREKLPKVVMSDDFDAAWEDYKQTYEENVDIDVYLDALDKEIEKRSGKIG